MEPTVERSPAREEALAEVLRPLMTDPKWYEESEVRRWSARIIAALPSVGLALVEAGSEPLTVERLALAIREARMQSGWGLHRAEGDAVLVLAALAAQEPKP